MFMFTVYVFIVRAYSVDPINVEQIMVDHLARVAMDMGYDRALIKKTIHRRLAELGMGIELSIFNVRDWWYKN